MPTDLITYLRLDDTAILEQRFRNIELCVKQFKAQHDYLQRISSDIEFAKQELAKWREKLDDCKTDMQNIVEAIDILNQPDDDEFETEDDDDG